MSSSLCECIVKTNRVPKCARCYNHGKKIKVKGHKKECEFRKCMCDKCILLLKRQINSAAQAALNRKIKLKESKGSINVFSKNSTILPLESSSGKKIIKKLRFDNGWNNNDKHIIDKQICPNSSPSVSLNYGLKNNIPFDSFTSQLLHYDLYYRYLASLNIYSGTSTMIMPFTPLYTPPIHCNSGFNSHFKSIY